MNTRTRKLTDLIEDHEKLAHKFTLLISAATADEPLSESARLGLLEFCLESVRDFNVLNENLKSYKESCAPS